MLPAGNRPILEHLVAELAGAGIRDVVIAVGYAGGQVRSYFGDGRRWGVAIEYLEERRQLGTAHAAGLARKVVDAPFLLMNGDIIIGRDDIRALAAMKAPAMAVFEVEDARRLGSVEVVDGKITGIHEKSENPPTRLANAGLYYLAPDVFDIIESLPASPRGEFEITDCLKLLAGSPSGLGYRLLDAWMDIGFPWDLLNVNESVLAGLAGDNQGRLEAGAVVEGPVQIGKNTVIRSGSYIRGPVVIGEECDIGPGCYIRPSTSIDDGCHIGAFVEIKNSIIMRGSKVPHQNYVGDSIVGENCNLGAGTRIANLRFDDGTVRVRGIDTGRRKFGAVIGDGVQTGINVTIDAGTCIGRGVRIWPGALVRGDIAPGTVIQ